MTTQLAFRDTQFNVVNHANQIWLTSKELAKALKYSSAKSVTDIYNKNEDEFTGAMSLVVDSTTNGINGSKRRMKIRVFSLRGAHLIAMFARTPVAKEFRRWVLDILDREAGKPTITPTNPIKRQPPKYRYTINLTVEDFVTGQKETFRGGANTPDEIIIGTARRFGMHIFDMMPVPLIAY